LKSDWELQMSGKAQLCLCACCRKAVAHSLAWGALRSFVDATAEEPEANGRVSVARLPEAGGALPGASVLGLRNDIRRLGTRVALSLNQTRTTVSLIAAVVPSVARR